MTARAAMEYSTEKLMRDLRGGTAHVVIEAMDYLRQDAADGQKNTPLHAVLLNPSLNGSARLLEAVVGELLAVGFDPMAKNRDGQTPRELAESIAAAENLTDAQYGAMNTVIWRLGEVERRLGADVPACRKPEKAERGAPGSNWVDAVLQQRQQLGSAQTR